jgi:hypothetical protein
MWIRQRWYDPAGALRREDGAYGPITAIVNGQPTRWTPSSTCPAANTRIYETHGAILAGLGPEAHHDARGVATAAGRLRPPSGAVTTTLGDVAAQAPGTAHESFHFC